jgi:hypothetical protein
VKSPVPSPVTGNDRACSHGRLPRIAVADPDALVLAFHHGMWTALIADRRTEWSYSAALNRVLAGSPGPAQVPPSHPTRDSMSRPGS